MNVIPIVFSFDDNLRLPAGVCMSSLLSNAYDDTFYDIYILHDDNAKYPNEKYFEKLYSRYVNFKITYINVGNPFPNAYEIRGVTIPAYYRLLIPDFIPHYDKIMYHDVDVIFRSDLSDIFLNYDLKDSYIGGVLSASFTNSEVLAYRSKIGVDPVHYINSGNLIFNNKLLRDDCIVELFKNEVRHDYKYQDQDIINLICRGRLSYLPVSFSGTIEMYKQAVSGIPSSIYNAKELSVLLDTGNVHYNGPKPWNELCPNFDIWWEYYRKSVFFDARYYFNFYHNRLNSLDRLSFKKRIKLLFRYFKVGQVLD